MSRRSPASSAAMMSQAAMAALVRYNSRQRGSIFSAGYPRKGACRETPNYYPPRHGTATLDLKDGSQKRMQVVQMQDGRQYVPRPDGWRRF